MLFSINVKLKLKPLSLQFEKFIERPLSNDRGVFLLS
jgi:hypothetical protein